MLTKVNQLFKFLETIFRIQYSEYRIHASKLIIIIILALFESSLKARANSTKTLLETINTPLPSEIFFEKVNLKIQIKRQEKNTAQSADKKSQVNGSSLENCPLQPKPFDININPTPLFEIQVENNLILLQIIGNTVLSREKIINSDPIKLLIQQIEGKNLTNEQFREVYTEISNGITQLYLNEGYITSKAIPQEPLTINENRVVEISVSEGRLDEIQIVGRGRLTLSYLCSRIGLGIRFPFNIIKLEEQLRLLERNSLLETIQANLKDSGKPGLSILTVSLQEANPFSLNLSVDNYSPPSIGSERLGLKFRYSNLTGLGDEIGGDYYYSTTGGANILDLIYRVPLNPMEGTLQFRATPNWTKITDSSLEELDITGNEQIYEISYRQPLIRTLKEEFALSLGFRYQDGRTFVFDQPAFFGNSRTSVIQFGQDYTRRDLSGIWFVRSQFNVGTGLFNPTTNDPPNPDGYFFSWVAQIQRLQRLGDNHLLIIQADLQLTPDTLLPDYLFIIGGGQSVRGYRQNARSGDNGFRFSIEDRITLQRNEVGNAIIQIAPFLDLGVVWNVANNPNTLPDQTFLIGAGIGLIWEPSENFRLRFDYGYPLINLEDRGDNFQDNGLYFEVNYKL